MFEWRLATTQVAVVSIAKLYGQMRPITMRGGCHAGFTSERYHCESVATKRREPAAYIAMIAVPRIPTTMRLTLKYDLQAQA